MSTTQNNPPTRQLTSTAPLLYAAVAIGAAVWLAFFLLGEERQVRARLGELQQILDKADGESQLVGVNKARRLGEMFTAQFVIDLAPFGLTVDNRQDLMRTAAGYRGRSAEVGVEFREESLTLDGDRAEHGLVATVTGARGGREAYRLHIQWAREEGEWKIARLDVLEVLEGNPGLF